MSQVMMGSSPSDHNQLTLECKPHGQAYPMINLIKSFGDEDDKDNKQQISAEVAAGVHSQTPQKLEEYLSRLEEERVKIDAFKRELPLCMQLLTYAMESSRQQLQSCRASSTQQAGKRPVVVLEEFIPIKQQVPEASDKPNENKNTTPNPSDKSNWMTSAQLWSSSGAQTATQKTQQYSSDHLKQNEIGLSNLSDNKRQRSGGGAFLPFTKECRSSSEPTNNNHNIILPDLALASQAESEMRVDRDNTLRLKGENGVLLASDQNSNRSIQSTNDSSMAAGTGKSPDISNQTTTTTTTTTQSTTNHRKQRRCWSPDLHRRFVNALQMLGGSQVATPKQIRELMKVDGLTNDEVKSHLQKYRLHTRRPGPSPQAPGTQAPQLVVLGGIWVPPEYAAAAAAAHHHGHGGPATMYSTAVASSQVTTQPQHYCASPPPVVPSRATLIHHNQQAIHQLHAYNNNKLASSQILQAPRQYSSPESEDQQGVSGGRSSESTEDAYNSEGSCRKASGSRRVESAAGAEEMIRKNIVVLGDDEECNGREITLKI